MNIILISNFSRPELVTQSIDSLEKNAAHWENHHLTFVYNGTHQDPPYFEPMTIMLGPVGASRSRNIGASSIPKYLRHEHVMFLDDDVYMCPGWDELLEKTIRAVPFPSAISGHAHPFNHHKQTVYMGGIVCHYANVLSTVHMMMPWSVWDDVGVFAEPGGPGGSEDVDWCKRAAGIGYGFAVTDPQCVIHCGLTSSSGKPIVGYDLMVEQNKRLIEHYGLEGKVQWE